MTTTTAKLLDSDAYYAFLAKTHPAMRISTTRLSVPSFVAPLDTREPLLPGPMRSLLTAVKAVWQGPVAPLSLFLGSPFERYCQDHLLDDIDDVGALKRQCVDAAQAEGADLVVVTNLGAHLDLQPYFDAGFVALPSFPDTVVDVAGKASFNDHLLTLPQGDRSGIRRNIKKFTKAGHRLRRLRGDEALGADLYVSYRPFFDQASVQWFPHTQPYFDGLAALSDDVVVTLAESADGDVLGFIVNFVDGDGLQSGRVGVHPDFHRKDAVYFRLIYHVVEEAIARGLARVSLEPTGYRMKRHLGADKVPLVNLCLGVSPMWRALLSGFAGLGRSLLSHLDSSSTLEKNY